MHFSHPASEDLVNWSHFLQLSSGEISLNSFFQKVTDILEHRRSL